MGRLSVQCPRCRSKYQVDESLAGKQARCKTPDCGHTFLLRGTSPSPLPLSPSPISSVGPSWEPGEVILGLYEVKGLLGEGGMGQVFQVRHRGWGVDLAVKTPRPDILSRAGAADNFEREAETWVNLGLHPHTVSCYYVRRVGELPCVFAEFVEGGSLKDWIDSGKLYEGGPDKALERILDTAIQFAWGLHYAHEQGLIHQDVKPANVLLTESGVTKVTDFGLAKARAVSGQATAAKPGQSILVSSGGMTPAYCSPEQAGREKLTRKTDVWSWAVSVLEMFTGDVTWPSGTVAGEALEAYLEAGSGDDRIPVMPPALAEALRRCLQRHPEGRPQNMQEVAVLLQDVYQSCAARKYSRETPQASKVLADSVSNQAISLIDLGRRDRAWELLEQAVKADPQALAANLNWGLLAWADRRVRNADIRARAEALIRAHPRSADAHLFKGLLHLEWREFADAVTTLEQSVRLHEGGAEGRNLLGVARTGLGDFAAAEAAFRAACELDPREADYLCNLGLALHHQGRRADALAALDRAARLRPDDPELQIDCAVARLQGHDAAAAWERLRQLVAAAGPGGRPRRIPGDALPVQTPAANVWSARAAAKWEVGNITQLAVSPDGSKLVTSNYDKKVTLWDLRTMTESRQLGALDATVRSLEFSPCGDYVLCGCSETGPGKGRAILWNAKTVKQSWPQFTGPRTFANQERLGSSEVAAAFSADGQFIVTSGNVITVWTFPGLRKVTEIRGDSRQARFTPDGRYIASSNTFRLTCFDSRSGETVGQCEPTVYGQLLNTSPDGKYLVIGGHGGKNGGAVYGLPAFDFVGEMTDEPQSSVNALAVSPDRTLAALGTFSTRGGRVELWDVRNRRLLWGQRTDRSMTQAIAFIPGTQSFLTAGPTGVQRWDVTFAEELPIRPRYRWAHHLAAIQTSEEALASQQEHERFLEQGEASLRSGQPRQAHAAFRKALAVPGHERAPAALAGLARTGRACRRTGVRGIWQIQELAFEGRVEYLAFSPDGRSLAAPSRRFAIDGDLRDANNLRPIPNNQRGFSAAIAADSRLLACAGGNAVRVWDLERSEEIWRQQFKEFGCDEVAFSPDGRFLGIPGYASDGNLAGRLTVMEARTGKTAWAIPCATVAAKHVAWSPDGRKLLVTGQGAEVRDAATQKMLWHNPNLFPDAIAFTPDSDMVVLASLSELHLLKAEDGSRVKEIGKDTTVGGFRRLAVTPKGEFVVGIRNTGRVELLSITSGQGAAAVEAHYGRGWSLALSPDGRWLATGGEDKRLCLWEIDWEWEWDTGAANAR